ncbi:RpiB/LacA/LacB family sugar-phosphate isomerase [bacterium]|jgi:ribose 5-phosphate isomerase B|nr:RpiB/LacA/LacB family sugar-phosphate isomerase [bacterium]MBT5015816.1 RpiB/LacA/LacB family sugar-phosphate isomerase [bacterium]
MIKVGIGVDHRGYALKNLLMQEKSIEWLDFGTDSSDRTDYPLFVPPVVDALDAGEIDYGVLICGTGIGMSIVANRYKKVYAALAWNKEVAVLSKEDDNSNILILPADFITEDQAREMLSAWLQAKFKGGRYEERLALFD